MTEIIVAGITAVLGILTAYFNYKQKKNSDVQKQIKEDKISFVRGKIKEVEESLIKAMETDITAVPLLRKTLEYYRKELKKLLSIFLLTSLFLVSGCITFGEKEPMIIGERIFKPNPGDVITVPALKTPAKQWYLIDDKAMLEILGVDKPTVPETIIGNSDK